MKKNLIATLILSATLLVAPTQMVYATEESQIENPSTWAQEEVSAAIEAGYVPEALQARYQEPITRQEFVDLYIQTIFTDLQEDYLQYTEYQLKSAYLLDERGMTPEVFAEKVETTWKFADTDNLNARVAQMLGVVNGDQNKNFNPNDNITREQVAVMVINGTQLSNKYKGDLARDFMTDIDNVSDWAYDAVNLIVSQGYMKGNSATTFNPKGTVTIEQAILMNYRISQKRTFVPFQLRGYQHIDRELIDNYAIDGDTIYIKSTGHDWKYSLVKVRYRKHPKLKQITYDYTTEQLLAHAESPVGDNSVVIWDDILSSKAGIDEYSDDRRRAIRCYEGEYQKYTYGDIFTVEHNVDGYLAIIRKNPEFKHYLGSYIGVIYMDENLYMRNVPSAQIAE